MQNRILVVDDEFAARRKVYLSLATASKSLRAHYPLKIDFAESPLDVPMMLARNTYALALVDVRLTKWGSDYDLRRIVDYIPTDLPICLVSEHWDDTTSDQVNHAWAHRNCRTFFQWSEIAGGRSEGRVRVLMQIAKIIGESEGRDSSVVLGPQDSIFLVHLSDLHITSDDEVDWDPEASRTSEAIRRACRDAAPTFIAVTGDVTHQGQPSEYRNAERWLRSVLHDTEFGQTPNGRLLMVPGNHDVCLPLAFSSRVVLGAADTTGKRYLEDTGNCRPELRELTISGLDPYRQFAAKLTGRVRPASTDESASLPWVEGQFRHLGVVFFGLNTARPLSSQTTAGQEVDARALTKITSELREIRRDAGKGHVVIGMSHHSPIGDVGGRSVSNPEAFSTFFGSDSRTSLFLHGHAHKRDVDWISKYRIIRCCAPTVKSGARPRDTLRGFSVVEICRSEYVPVTIHVSCFDWRDDGVELSKIESFTRRRDGTFEPEQLTKGR